MQHGPVLARGVYTEGYDGFSEFWKDITGSNRPRTPILLVDVVFIVVFFAEAGEGSGAKH